MRNLTPTLLEAQKGDSLEARLKAVFSRPGGPACTFLREDILEAELRLEPYSQRGHLLLDNSDGCLTGLDLRGYDCRLFFGALTPAGEEYSPQPPLKVLGQEFISSPSRLVCRLELAGLPDLLARDRAAEKYLPEETDNLTVKELITAIAGAVLAPYAHCTPCSAVFEDAEELMDGFKPKDGFRIYTGDDRLSKIRELLEYADCQMRVREDGALHFFVPVTSGEVYDYSYTLEDGHPFFSKTSRHRLVIPNKVTVRSQPGDEPQYSGSATSADSYALLPGEDYRYARLSSGSEAESIARAIIRRCELGAETGSATVPLNAGAEVWDYIRVTDGRQGDQRCGNIGRLKFLYRAPQNGTRLIWKMEFSFGDWTSLPGILESLGTTATELQSYLTRLKVKDLYAENIQAENINLDRVEDGVNYKKVSAVHIDGGHIKLDGNILYAAGYNPAEKFDLGVHTLDSIPEGTTYKRVLSTEMQAGRIVLTDAGFLVKHDRVVGGSETGNRTELTASGLRGYNGSALQFEVRASDGKAYAGAGAVVLDASGITVQGQLLRLTDGSVTGYLYQNNGALTLANTGNIRVYPTGGVLDVQANILPGQDEGYDLGNADYRWNTGHISWLYSSYLIGRNGGFADLAEMEWLDLPLRSTPPVGYNGRCYFNTSSGHPFCYDNGLWRAFGNCY